MRTGQLSERSGVNIETIRYYERVGLLQRPRRTAKGYRTYEPTHLQRLLFLRRSRQLGFSLQEVRELLELANEPQRACKDVACLAAAHLAAVRAKSRELARLQRSLERLVRSCPGKVSVAECGFFEALTNSEATSLPESRTAEASRPARPR